MADRRWDLIDFGLELKAKARARAAGLETLDAIAARFQALPRHDGSAAFDVLVEWTRARFAFAGVRNAVVGVSGGVDSSLVACILADALPRTTWAYVLPCESAPRDEADARALCKALNLPVRRIDLTAAYLALKQVLAGSESTPTANGNLKTRLRTAALFHEAAVQRALLVGTGDLDEGFIGYYTKGSSTDVSLIGGLHKSDVRRLLRLALRRRNEGLARRLAARPADAGLGGRPAEEELGLTYRDIERAQNVVAATCGLVETGIYPHEVEVFAEALAASGLTMKTFRAVADRVAAARHKAVAIVPPRRR